jgi:hypothetical protein
MNKTKRNALNRSVKRLITRYSKMKRMQDSLNITETYSEVVEHARYQRWSRTYDSKLRIEQLRRERSNRRRRSQRRFQEPAPATWDSAPVF